MKKKINLPGFIFKSIYSENTTKEEIKRQDDILEIEFPVFNKNQVLKTAEILALKKRRAHDRNIDDVLDFIDQLGALWRDPYYDIRKEALEVLPMITGQSKKLIEIELMATLMLCDRKVAEAQLIGEIGGKQYLEDWIPKGNTRIHAQPRGLVFHNLAGNAFNLGLLTLYFGLITKNVNLIKLSHGEPYFLIRLCESILDIDKKIAKEIAAIYWQGSKGDIYDDLFNSGHVDCVLAWGGIQSIEDIRRRANRYGIKIIDHGPKLSFSVISDDIFKNIEVMREAANKIAIDLVYWNQKACLSPRIIYIVEKPHKVDFTQIEDPEIQKSNSNLNNFSLIEESFSDNGDIFIGSNNHNIVSQMQRSMKLLKNEISELSTKGFAKLLAQGLKEADTILPRSHLTQADGIQMNKKREYFLMNYAFKKRASLFYPSKDKLDWTAIYLRDLPSMKEVDMCQDRFVIVTRISNIQDLIYSIRKEDLQQYLQTVSIYGTDDFVKEVSEELSLLGANRFPRIGEHNVQSIGMPWDGHYTLQEMIKWVYIAFLDQKSEEDKTVRIDLMDGLDL